MAHILECEKLEVPPANFFFFFATNDVSPYVYCLGHLHSRKSRLRKLLFELEAYLEALVVTFDVARAVCFIIQSASTLE